MVGELCGHGRAAMHDLRLVLNLQATIRVTEIVESHRDPTHPSVIPCRFGKGQRLAHLSLIAQTTGPVMPLDHTRVDDVVPEEIQDVLEAGFAMHDAHLDALHPTPFIVFFDLPIGQALRPAQDQAPGLPWGAGGGGRIATAKGFEARRLKPS